MAKAKALRGLVLAMGVACVLIGLFHELFGIASVPGESSAGATVDSRERFYNAIFAGYGVAWLWVARQRPIPATAVRWLAGVFLLGGAGRVISIAVQGWPQWFQVVLSVIELVLPPVYFWLADSEEQVALTQVMPGSEAGSPVAGPRRR
ncbi:DUF4345 domain-containing protein [Streptomyces sp. NPDC001393]